MKSCIYQGTVRHRRFAPIVHQFRPSLFLMYLDLAELPSLFRGQWLWSVERSNVAAFRRSDHFGDPAIPMDEAVRSLVELRLGRRPTGPIRMLTHLRYFGYCFNPLSVFFCFEPDGQALDVVVAEVSNTPWNERHCYVLPARDGEAAVARPDSSNCDRPVEKVDFRFDKAFHVSPFMGMDVQYRWQLVGPGPQLTLHAENWRGNEVFFDASLMLKRREITSWNLVLVLMRFPLMTIQVTANIYWQALLLWWKRLPYIPHPTKTSSEVKPT